MQCLHRGLGENRTSSEGQGEGPSCGFAFWGPMHPMRKGIKPFPLFFFWSRVSTGNIPIWPSMELPFTFWVLIPVTWPANDLDRYSLHLFAIRAMCCLSLVTFVGHWWAIHVALARWHLSGMAHSSYEMICMICISKLFYWCNLLTLTKDLNRYAN